MKIYLALLLILILYTNAEVVFNYPQFSQCSPLWGQKLMGNKLQCKTCNQTAPTICDSLAGSLITSISMALSGKNIKLNNTVVYGVDFVDQIIANNFGYLCGHNSCVNLKPSILNYLSPQVTYKGRKKLSLKALQTLLYHEKVIIGHVKETPGMIERYVLITGWLDSDNSTIYVNDPYYEYNPCAYNTFIDMMIYDMK